MNSLWSVIKADWKNGIKRVWGTFAVVSIFAGITCENCISSLQSYLSHIQSSENVSVLECFIYLMRGMKEYVPSNSINFELPITFIVLYLLMAYMIGDYAVKDINGYGIQLLIKTGNKHIWWISKCIWNAMTVLMFYISLCIGIIVVWIISGSKGGILNINENVIRRTLALGNEVNIPTLSFLLLGIMTIVCTSMAICIGQMILSFYIKPILSFVMVAILYVISGYYQSKWLIGNYLMLYRSDMVNSNGVSIRYGLFIDITLIFISVFIGYIFFVRRDLIK